MTQCLGKCQDRLGRRRLHQMTIHTHTKPIGFGHRSWENIPKIKKYIVSQDQTHHRYIREHTHMWAERMKE